MASMVDTLLFRALGEEKLGELELLSSLNRYQASGGSISRMITLYTAITWS